MFIPVDIWGTYNTFLALPSTCSLSLERKRSALCQGSVGDQVPAENEPGSQAQGW